MPEERKFASADALGAADREFEEVRLPVMGDYVRVRYLTTPDVTRITFLPDLAGFQELSMKLQADVAHPEVETDELAAETYHYEAWVAHVAVLAGEDTEPVFCTECGFDHAPSLWSAIQTNRMHPKDLDEVCNVALSAQTVGSVRPFSVGQMLSDSPLPVGTGESIPPTNS